MHTLSFAYQCCVSDFFIVYLSADLTLLVFWHAVAHLVECKFAHYTIVDDFSNMTDWLSVPILEDGRNTTR